MQSTGGQGGDKQNIQLKQRNWVISKTVSTEKKIIMRFFILFFRTFFISNSTVRMLVCVQNRESLQIYYFQS